MPQGDKRGAYDFYDWNYDGEWRGEYLSNGLGSLTDSNLGPADYKLGYYAKSKKIETKLYLLLYPAIYSQNNKCSCYRSSLGWLET